jgi:hypothetical protein
MGVNARNFWRASDGFDADDPGVVTRPYTLPAAQDNDVGAIVRPDYTEGPNRYVKTSWFDDGVPVVNSVICYGRAHNNIVSDAFMLWEDWFCHWSWDEGGARAYSASEGGAGGGGATVLLEAGAVGVRPGDSVELAASFAAATETNAAVLTFAWDAGAFEYAGFEPAAGASVVDEAAEAGALRVTLMIPDYGARALGTLTLRAQGAAHSEREGVALEVEYALRDENGGKSIATASAGAAVVIGAAVEGDTNGDGVVDLIDLSNLIDWFGATAADPEWAGRAAFDQNGNGEIDITDIAHVARLIGQKDGGEGGLK